MMNSAVVAKLNNLNKTFYQKTANEFDETRDYYWAGWEKVPTYLENFQKPIRVLDIGCGNGRFGQFFIEKGFEIDYTGIDFDPYLLEKAQERLQNAQLIQADILNFDLNSLNKTLDLIVLFGVLHHIPGYKNRLRVLSAGIEALKQKGLVVFNSWHFTDSASLMGRKVDFSEVGLNESDVEENDYLLDWSRGETALRYCHFVSDEEGIELIKEAGLTLREVYKSNQKGDHYNKYYIAAR